MQGVVLYRDWTRRVDRNRRLLRNRADAVHYDRPRIRWEPMAGIKPATTDMVAESVMAGVIGDGEAIEETRADTLPDFGDGCAMRRGTAPTDEREQFRDGTGRSTVT